MLSPASLAAFSTGVAQPAFGQPRSVQRVRSTAPQPVQPAAPQPSLAAPGRDGDAPPSRLLPRGSLLDLSV
jgi:hypothetical protein